MTVTTDEQRANLIEAGQHLAAVLRALEEAQRNNWLATGLIYVNTEKPSLVETYNLVDTPLNRLGDVDLRPAPEMIDKINALMF